MTFRNKNEKRSFPNFDISLNNLFKIYSLVNQIKNGKKGSRTWNSLLSHQS
jgi:hypothetical protein